MESVAKDQGDALADRRLAFLLDHPMRVRIAAEMETSYREPTELAEALGESLPRVAYHCRVLAAGGCKPAQADGS
jgi:hypothetical protein